MNIINSLYHNMSTTYIVDGDKGLLEFLIDNRIPRVNISVQYGCSIGCKFCDAPKVGFGIENATYDDMKNMIMLGVKQLELKNIVPTRFHFPETEYDKYHKFILIGFCKMGDPSFNTEVIEVLRDLKEEFDPIKIYPEVSTCMPKYNSNLQKFLQDWMKLQNYTFEGKASLQISLHTTDESKRKLISQNYHTLEEISDIMNKCDRPIGRKIRLSFGLTSDLKIDTIKLNKLFPPKWYSVALRPIFHHNEQCIRNAHKELYTMYCDYKQYENIFEQCGYSVCSLKPVPRGFVAIAWKNTIADLMSK